MLPAPFTISPLAPCSFHFFVPSHVHDVAHKRLANSILPQDLIDSTSFCLVELPLFVWLTYENPTKMGVLPINNALGPPLPNEASYTPRLEFGKFDEFLSPG